MSIATVGGDPAQLWQLLRQSRTQAPDPDRATGGSTSLPGQQGADAPAGAPASAPGGLGNAAAKILSDLQSFLLQVQAGTSGTPANAATGATAGGSATTVTGAANDPAASVLSDLHNLFSDLGKAAGGGDQAQGHHHHHHHANPAANPAGSASASVPATGASATA